MQENDTVYLLANVSACMVWQVEMNHLFKKNDTIYVETYLNGDFIDSSNSYLAKVPYVITLTDSLNFENLFTYLDLKNINDEKINSNVITVIHNLDTVKYYSNGLGDHLYNIEYYNSIKRRIYPNASIYQPIELIQPPIPDSANNNLNLIK
ncbi:hypothetical protein [Acidiluteibacter ferrifornacis]|uniref:Uncharacterized protein n=1 Tax=Acidiluteibacter ferrifornacis TaxID=2692424 RepID=A0A6N9NQQ9_9FLAO|nr:hypothetical protein [Acidiluteibacter ferrifornacis]NBG67407.1 hypothetical protein [Acidiluteibacter ferrifornacis]